MKRPLFLSIFSLVILGSTAQIAWADSVCLSRWPWGACALWETTSELSSGGSSGGRLHDEIYFKNECARKIQTAVHFMDEGDNWRTNAWYDLEPGESKYLANSYNTHFYVYGESIDPIVQHRLKWDGNATHVNVPGAGNVGFREVVTNPNVAVKYTYRFNCDGVHRYKAIALAWNGNGAWATRSHNTIDLARNDAINACSGCNLSPSVVDPRGPGCIAVVRGTGTDRLFSHIGQNQNDARNGAINSCRASFQNCSVENISCNY